MCDVITDTKPCEADISLFRPANKVNNPFMGLLKILNIFIKNKETFIVFYFLAGLYGKTA